MKISKMKLNPLISLIFFTICNAYTIKNSFNYTNFFNNFIFETISDPTHGTVQYINKAAALSSGLASYTVDNKVYLGVGKQHCSLINSTVLKY